MHKGIFINNYFIEFNKSKSILKHIKVGIYSKGSIGKTCLLFRLTENYYPEETFTTIGVDFRTWEFEYNYNEYKIEIWETKGHDNYKNMSLNYLKYANIILILIDLTDLEGLDKNFIGEIKSIIFKDCLIYLVLINIDLLEVEKRYRYNLFECRKIAKLLIENKHINYNFEVSSKTKKGIDNLVKNIKWYILRNDKCHKVIFRNNCLEKYLSI